MGAGEPRLYVMPGSHPCAAVEAAFAIKGLPYRRVLLLPVMQLLAGPLFYGGLTVPGMRIGRERIVGSRRIMRRLDQLQPEPALAPSPSEPRYAELLEAERWGDEVLQSVPRRIIDAAFLRDPATIESFGSGERFPLPWSVMRPALPLTAKLMALRNHAGDENARADVLGLPRQLDRIDGWVRDGLLGSDQPRAADLQIGSTIRLLQAIGDLETLLAGRPSLALARYFPPERGNVPAGILPPAWIADARAASTSG